MPEIPLILVVDDEPYIAELLAELLMSEITCTVTTVFNGLQALSAARAQRPDLIITDLMMPYMDGHALINALREDDSLRQIPVIVMSAVSQRPTWVQEEKLTFLSKPFEPDELLDMVRRAL